MKTIKDTLIFSFLFGSLFFGPILLIIGVIQLISGDFPRFLYLSVICSVLFFIGLKVFTHK